MCNTDSGLLVTALEKTIKKINKSFGESWLHTGSAKTGAGTPGKNTHPHPEVCNYTLQPSYHNFTEICMCTEGMLEFESGDEFISLEEGHGIIILPDVMHCEIPIKDRDYTVLWLVIKPSKARLHLSGTKGNEFFTSDFSPLSQNYEYNAIMDNIINENRNNDEQNHMMIKLYLLRMYVIALRELQGMKPATGSDYSSWKESVVAEIKDCISERGPGHIKLHDISQDVCISENHMNHIFKSVTGTTITQYMEMLRVNRAKQLLVNSTITIDSISNMLGYYDRYHFGKSFKKATGYSPGRFRKQKQE